MDIQLDESLANLMVTCSKSTLTSSKAVGVSVSLTYNKVEADYFFTSREKGGAKKIINKSFSFINMDLIQTNLINNMPESLSNRKIPKRIDFSFQVFFFISKG